MIIFVIDQIAGAEYLLPLLKLDIFNSKVKYRVYSSKISKVFFEQHQVDAVVLSEPELNNINDYIPIGEISFGLLSASADSSLEEAFKSYFQSNGIKAYQFIDTWSNNSKRFKSAQNKLDLPDGILTIDSTSKMELLLGGIPENLIHLIGQPAFENYYFQQKKRPQIHKSECVLFVSQPIRKYYECSLGYDENIFIKDCLSVWKAKDLKWANFHILVHPEEDISNYVAIAKRYSHEIPIIQNDKLDLHKYRAVIGMFSSILTFSYLSRSLTLSYQPGAISEDKCFLSKYDMIERILNVNQLSEWMSVRLGKKVPFFQEVDDSFFYDLEGSLNRLLKFVMERYTKNE